MTLLEIFQIEREVADKPAAPALTVKRVPANNPNQICLVLEWPEGTITRSHKVCEFSDYHDWKLHLGSKS
jgi:hypothetical protein